jgi:hypothetical protein
MKLSVKGDEGRFERGVRGPERAWITLYYFK